MRADWDSGALLAGPRGRRLCWELVTHSGGWGWEEPPESAGAAGLAAALGVAVARSDVGALAVTREPASFFLALADAVAWAMYWQELDDRDRRLADPRAAEQLWPVAEAVSSAVAARWWWWPMDPAIQHEVVFDDPDGRALPDAPYKAEVGAMAGATGSLARYRLAPRRREITFGRRCARPLRGGRDDRS